MPFWAWETAGPVGIEKISSSTGTCIVKSMTLFAASGTGAPAYVWDAAASQWVMMEPSGALPNSYNFVNRFSGQDIAGAKNFVTDLQKAGASVEPSGQITMFAGATAPNGWLLCQGQAVSRTTYASLFSVISTTYGAGDGSTTFNVPNLVGRVAVGLNSGDAIMDALGETGGSKDSVAVSHSHNTSHSHTTPASTSGGHSVDHTHGITLYSNTAFDSTSGGRPVGGDGTAVPATPTANGATNGASTSHTHTVPAVTTDSQSVTSVTDGVSGTNANLPPFITLNYIIKT
jgi:microcystin-dependent protein